MTRGPNAPTRRGHCPVCGFHGALNRLGLIRTHNVHRIGRRGGEYAAADRCDGSNERPEPLELTA